MTKIKFFFNKDRETEWLNEMSRQGWAMTGYFLGFYSFERCEQGEYVYQIDFTDGFWGVSSNYRRFMNETGVEIVCQWGFWVILRRKAAEGAFELYTDVESQIAHYAKIRTMFKAVVCIEAVCLIVELFAIMSGAGWIGWVSACVVAALMLAFAREVGRINEILAELRSRNGTAQEGRTPFRRRMSILLPIGMLLNAFSIAMGRTDLESSFLRGFVLGLAIVFLLTGLALTAIKRD